MLNMMGELLGITGAIGSGKTTFAQLLAKVEPSHALYEASMPIAEVADALNQALRAEMTFEMAVDDIDLINQALIWLPDTIHERLHIDTTWAQIAVNRHDCLAHPGLYMRMFSYLEEVKKHPELLDSIITSKNKANYRDLLQWLGGYLVAKVSPTIWFDEIIRRIQQRDTDKKLIIVGGVRYISDALVIADNGGRIIEITRPKSTASTDITERERTKIKPDITVANNGSLADLAVIAERIWADLGAQTITQHYSTAKQ